MYIEIEKIPLIERTEQYPDGANSPTVVTRYRCPCGKGELVEENTIGFNDHFVTLECKQCLKKYHPFVDIVGYDFRLHPIRTR